MTRSNPAPPPSAVADAWLVTDGAAGNEKQAQALAAALDRSAQTLRVAVRAPWRWLAPRWVPREVRALGLPLAPPWPALAIGCGRQGALALRTLKQLSGGATRTVQILDPRIDPAAFDLVIAPRHDGLHGDNVIVTHGALNAIDSAWLARARLEWARLGALPAPRTVVLLGGSNRALQVNRRYWRGLAHKLEHWLARDGGSVLISTSRRSPDWLRSVARSQLDAMPGLQWHGDSDGPNPYAGLLAWADRIVVSPDSVNLLSEACATEAPVVCHLDKPLRGKLATFYRDLLEAGRVRPMKLEYAAWDVQPLRETEAVADQVRERLGL